MVFTYFGSLASPYKVSVVLRLGTGLCITGGGDALAQIYEHPGEFDYHRGKVLALYGLAITGGFNHYWFRALDRFFGVEMTALNALKKTAAEQFTVGPFEVAFFIGWVHVLSGRTHELPEKYRKDLLPVVLANWMVWVPAQMVNFYLVPEPLRVLYICFLSTLWNGFLSYVSHNSLTKTPNS